MRGKAIFIAICLALSTVTTVAAQTGSGYDLTWNTVAGGGSSAGEAYILNGTAGQPDAGVMAGGVYTLDGGFWAGIPGQWNVYVPLVMK